MKKKLFTGKFDFIVPRKHDKEIGDRLRLFRRSRAATLQEFGKDVDISQGSLSDLENGNSLPSATTLISLYHAGCDIHWLLTGDR